jgi:hypothetical protein
MMSFNEWAMYRELFDNPGEYEWTSKTATSWTAAWEVNGKRYEASFDDKEAGQDHWLFSFWQTYPRPTMGISGTGDAGQVFSVVVKIGKDFIKEKKPAVVTFSAMEGNRRTLYARMMERFAPELGYSGSYDTSGNFTLTRNDEGTPGAPTITRQQALNPNLN